MNKISELNLEKIFYRLRPCGCRRDERREPGFDSVAPEKKS